MIGRRCTHGNVFSRPVLIGRGLGARARYGMLTGAAAASTEPKVTFAPAPRGAIGGGRQRDHGSASTRFPVAIAAGSHPFPSRTRKLSPPAPMVLEGRPSGRVGRRRNTSSETTPPSARGCLASTRPPRGVVSRPPALRARRPPARHTPEAAEGRERAGLSSAACPGSCRPLAAPARRSLEGARRPPRRPAGALVESRRPRRDPATARVPNAPTSSRDPSSPS